MEKPARYCDMRDMFKAGQQEKGNNTDNKTVMEIDQLHDTLQQIIISPTENNDDDNNNNNNNNNNKKGDQIYQIFARINFRQNKLSWAAPTVTFRGINFS